MSVLVLNAGVLTFGTVESRTPKSQQDMMDTNMYHVAMLARMLLPQLKQRKGNTALIINSSAAYMKWFPAGAVYSASKAFVTFLAEGLAIELKDSNVDV